MKFAVTPTGANTTSEAMRIIENGYLGIGETAPGYNLSIKSTTGCFIDMDTVNNNDTGINFRCEDALMWKIWNDAAGHSTGAIDTLVVSDTGGDDGVYRVQNNEAAWVGFSDERSKTSLVPIENAVDKLNTLQAVNYKWKYGNEARRTRNNIGLLAQEVNKVFPEAVISCDEALYEVIDHPVFEGEKQAQGQWGLAPTTLIPVLVKAIQELSAKVTALENA